MKEKLELTQCDLGEIFIRDKGTSCETRVRLLSYFNFFCMIECVEAKNPQPFESMIFRLSRIPADENQ